MTKTFKPTELSLDGLDGISGGRSGDYGKSFAQLQELTKVVAGGIGAGLSTLGKLGESMLPKPGVGHIF